MRWGCIKYTVKQFAEKYSIDKAKHVQLKGMSLTLGFCKELKLQISTDFQEITKEYYDCEQELDIIHNYITEGIIM